MPRAQAKDLRGAVQIRVGKVQVADVGHFAEREEGVDVRLQNLASARREVPSGEESGQVWPRSRCARAGGEWQIRKSPKPKRQTPRLGRFLSKSKEPGGFCTNIKVVLQR